MDGFDYLKRWLSFAGFVLVVAVLYWAQVVLIPVALAILLTFVLIPPVAWFQRWLGRVGAVCLVVAVVFAALGLTAWGVSYEITNLALELPTYRDNIRQKIDDVRSAGKGGSVQKVQDALKDINTELTKTETPIGSASSPLIVKSEQVDALWGFPAWLGPFIGPLATAALVIVLVVTMLLERVDLRNRLIGLFGHGRLAITTKGIEEAGNRVSRQLLMQALVNLAYGLSVGAGLYFIGVPYAFLWAALAGVLRFIPYVGPIIGAGAPILVSAAAMPGWYGSFWVMSLFLALELFTNLILETMLYAGSAGVSQVALLVSVAFWTWLWGPMGLLLSIPLTVCVVVLGKHVPGLEMIGTLMADRPALPPEAEFYQRLVARDPNEAMEIIERHVKTQPLDTVYDALLLPALNYAERDRFDARLSTEEEDAVIKATRELLDDTGTLNRAQRLLVAKDGAGEALSPAKSTLSVLGYPAESVADELALHMLNQLLEGTEVSIDVVTKPMSSSEIVATVKKGGCQVLCIVDLPPSAPSRTRYVIRKLRAAIPNLQIIVGRLAPPALADENSHLILESGATRVFSNLVQLRDHLLQLVPATPPLEPVEVLSSGLEETR